MIREFAKRALPGSVKMLLPILAAIPAGCGAKNEKPAPSLLDKAAFETTLDGKQVSLYTLEGVGGLVLQVTNYGARMESLWVPDREGVMRDVIWGYPSIEAALAGNRNSGPIVGRYGNRIAGGRFTLDGTEYRLNLNNGPNHLHGGPRGWGMVVWDAVEFTDPAGNPAVGMRLVSPDGDENYPGTVAAEVTYTVTPLNEVVIDYRATTDAPTVLNPTSHPYFNLHGTTDRTILSHLLTIHADAFTPTDEGLIPTGEIRPVEGTPFDFREPVPVGARVDSDYGAIAPAGGYDHNWVLDKPAPGAFAPAAEVYEPATGISMRLITDQPGVQFYSGNNMDGTDVGKYGRTHDRRSSFALEAQHFPDSPNHPGFPSTVLRPGEVYTQHTVYAFSTR